MQDAAELATIANEETVSLIDLVAVVLKHRRIIIISTLCAVVLGIAAYLLYPPYSLARAERERIVEANMSLMLGSNIDDGISDVGGSNFLMQSLTDPAKILVALRTAGYSTIDKIQIDASADQDKVLYMIRRRLIENKGIDGAGLKESSRRYSVKLDKGVVSIIFKNGDAEKATAFLTALSVVGERDLRAFALPFAKSTIEAYEQLLMVQNPSESIEASIALGYRNYSLAKALAAGTVSPLLMLREPYVLIPELSLAAIRKDVLKKVIILVFGVLFMAVFVAFVLQYVDSVKKDPESMRKIQNALRER